MFTKQLSTASMSALKPGISCVQNLDCFESKNYCKVISPHQSSKKGCWERKMIVGGGVISDKGPDFRYHREKNELYQSAGF